MASGRSDYWYGMLPGKSAIGVGQTEWYSSTQINFSAESNMEMISYTVPAGYKLHIDGGMISSQSPGIQRFKILINSVVLWDIFYDQVLKFPWGVSDTYKLTEGKILSLEGWNHDSVECLIWVAMFGFLEYIVI